MSLDSPVTWMELRLILKPIVLVKGNKEKLIMHVLIQYITWLLSLWQIMIVNVLLLYDCLCCGNRHRVVDWIIVI